MPEHAFTDLRLRWLVVLATGALLSCGDEVEDTSPPTQLTTVSPARPGPAAPKPEATLDLRAPPGVGSRELVAPVPVGAPRLHQMPGPTAADAGPP